MTRFTHLLAALSLAGLFTGATIVACGGSPGSPGEMPPVAPRPDPIDPSAIPVPGAPMSTGTDARVLSPVGASGAISVPMPAFQPVVGAAVDAGIPSDAPSTDAGPVDAAMPPLKPLPDGSVPADSRMEPILQRDAR